MLTATASWPTSNTRSALFVLRGALISLALFGLLRLGWVEAHALIPMTLAQAALAIRLFGVPTLPIDVTLACSGTDAISLCLGAILAYPAPWRQRITGAAGATGMILLLNIARIGTIGRAAHSPFWFGALHLYVWPAVITLSIAAYVFVWMNRSQTAEQTGARSTPLPSRRFIALAALFLLVFLIAAPWYLNSPAVLVIAAFIARTAAALLTVAGIHASATANILWAPHGGFLVTEECISTPLIPIYLAAVIAYSPNWKRLSIGLAATLPLFILLGVVRLLVVALPQSVAAQSFFIHAFYQLFAGAAIVIGAACWRHRNKSAVAYSVAGIAAASTFIALAGQVYLRLISAPSGTPSVDPQGAMAFLPAFQTALYLALWIAAGTDTAWKRLATGLAVLVGLQIAGLFALDMILTHSVMTMAVRDVRAWAIAAPVLIFAAMVTSGRPRR